MIEGAVLIGERPQSVLFIYLFIYFFVWFFFFFVTCPTLGQKYPVIQVIKNSRITYHGTPDLDTLLKLFCCIVFSKHLCNNVDSHLRVQLLRT